MTIVETLFDLLSASAGATFGALFTFFLNSRRNKKIANQLTVSRQALEKIKLENEQLLQKIHDKENLILQMEMQILGNKSSKPQKQKENKTQNNKN